MQRIRLTGGFSKHLAIDLLRLAEASRLVYRAGLLQLLEKEGLFGRRNARTRRMQALRLHAQLRRIIYFSLTRI